MGEAGLEDAPKHPPPAAELVGRDALDRGTARAQHPDPTTVRASVRGGATTETFAKAVQVFLRNCIDSQGRASHSEY